MRSDKQTFDRCSHGTRRETIEDGLDSRHDENDKKRDFFANKILSVFGNCRSTYSSLYGHASGSFSIQPVRTKNPCGLISGCKAS
jgi:hypothetical protein